MKSNAQRSGEPEIKVDPSLPVLILECHHGSLGIARSLGRLGIEVYGVDRNPPGPAFRSRYFCGTYQWDLLLQPPEASVSFLLDVARRLNRKMLLIPTSDATAVLVADNAEELQEFFVFAKQPPQLVRQLVSKRESYFLAKSHGVPVPAAEFPDSVTDVRDFAERAEFPVMLKAIDNRKSRERNGCKVVIASSKAELIRLHKELEDPADPNLMLQEYIPGDDDTIWMFNGFFDNQGNCHGACTGRKLRQTPPHVGSTALGICEPNDVVERTTVKWMQDIGYTGILDIGYRYDARDGQYKLLDPNPRIGSTFRLFVGHNGMDVVRYLYLDKTDQPLPTTTPRYGRKWFVEEADLASFFTYWREGSLGFWEWLRSFSGVEESAWFAVDDLRPLWSLGLSVAKRTARWRRKRTTVGANRRLTSSPAK